MPSSSAERALSWHEWKDGIKLPTIQSRFLCSSRDPIAEASKWCDRYAQNLNSATRILVIGLGAGFHLRELRLRYPKVAIVAIEKEAELIQTFQAAAASEVRCILAEDANKALPELTDPATAVLQFLPACAHWLEEASELAGESLGRSVRGLNQRLKNGGLTAKAPEGATPLRPSRELFYQLSAGAETEEEKALWGILGEMVK